MGLPIWYQSLINPHGGTGIVLNEGTPNDAPMNSGLCKDLYTQLVQLGVQYMMNGVYPTVPPQMPGISLVISKQSVRPASQNQWDDLAGAWYNKQCPILNVSAACSIGELPDILRHLAGGEYAKVPRVPEGMVASMGHSPTPGPLALLLAVAAVSVDAQLFDGLRASGILPDALVTIIEPLVAVYPRGYYFVREPNPVSIAAQVAQRANTFKL